MQPIRNPGIFKRFFYPLHLSERSLIYKLSFFAFFLLFCFGILGVVWAIPVPHFNFLGKLNGYLNLATVLIFSLMVYCFRQSVKLSFVVGIVICIFSAGIITLEKLDRLAGWPHMGVVCLGILVVSGIGLLVLNQTGSKR